MITVRGISDVNAIFAQLAPKEARNLARVVVLDIAKTGAGIAIKHTPDNPKTGAGDLKSSIKAKRARGERGKEAATVSVTNTRRNYFWPFLERGDGPDHVEHAMFGKTIEEMRPDMHRIYVEAFAKKLIARLVRERKRLG